MNFQEIKNELSIIKKKEKLLRLQKKKLMTRLYELMEEKTEKAVIIHKTEEYKNREKIYGELYTSKIPLVLHNLIIGMTEEEEDELPNILSFGKYRGKSIEYIIRNGKIQYLGWVMGEDFIRTPHYHHLGENIMKHLRKYRKLTYGKTETEIKKIRMNYN